MNKFFIKDINKKINSLKVIKIFFIFLFFCFLLWCLFFCYKYCLKNQKIKNVDNEKKLLLADTPKFSDYNVEELGESLIKPVPVNLNSHPKANEFRTTIRNAEENGPNFAYKYTIATWGCGTACHSYAVIDSSNGNVYFSNIGAQLGVSYNINSHLLIVDPPEMIYENYGNNIDDALYPATKYYVWKNNDFKFIGEWKITYFIKKQNNNKS